VTVITGLAVAPAQLAELATRLKRVCGSGGAVKEGKIEIQGDHREKVLALLKELGHRAKTAGG
jgi:translation initiation factor 1